jgi:hypothetical protein
MNYLNKFKAFGKTPKALFNKLEVIEKNGVFFAGKTPFGGNFLRRRFVLIQQ